jgi:Ca2+-binding RTX toxin-like protein
MHRSRFHPAGALAAAAVSAALAVPATASASVQADLRVEGAGKALGAAGYYTDSARIRTTRSTACPGSGQVKPVQGPTALGLLWSASSLSRSLRPLAVSDQYDFGLLVCGIGGFTAAGDSSYWLYKVDHKSPEVGADQLRLKGGEQVLWFFSDSAAGENTGDELALQAPARARPGASFAVRAFAYDAGGKRTAAAGAEVGGTTTDAQGRATVTAPGGGTLRLRAERRPDIPSQELTVCIGERSKCPAHRGKRIFGSGKGERIAGGRGRDRIYAGGGGDRIAVRGGGRDTVRCGGGRDTVKADRSDRVARDCEIVRRR